MKTLFQSTVLIACLCIASQAKEVTLTVNNSPGVGTTNFSDGVSIGTNEVAEVRSVFGSGDYVTLNVIKNGITNSTGLSAYGYGGLQRPAIAVAGPATIRLVIESSGGTLPTKYWFCSVKIEPESFPPDKTIILPEGVVGVIHVESSTNLIQWQDEWVNTFSNSNQNRFFRLRAERL